MTSLFVAKELLYATTLSELLLNRIDGEIFTKIMPGQIFFVIEFNVHFQHDSYWTSILTKNGQMVIQTCVFNGTSKVECIL